MNLPSPGYTPQFVPENPKTPMWPDVAIVPKALPELIGLRDPLARSRQRQQLFLQQVQAGNTQVPPEMAAGMAHLNEVMERGGCFHGTSAVYPEFLLEAWYAALDWVLEEQIKNEALIRGIPVEQVMQDMQDRGRALAARLAEQGGQQVPGQAETAASQQPREGAEVEASETQRPAVISVPAEGGPDLDTGVAA